MLIEFSFANYRSFRDEATLSMEAAGLGAFKNSLIPCNSLKLLPGVGLFGKNGGGKSNVIRAFWLAAQFIRNAQRTQHDGARVPVTPFLLDERSAQRPSSFSFVYVYDQTKYWYGFSATREKLTAELRELVHGEPDIRTCVDPETIGGIIVRVGDTLFDASIATQLKNVRQQMIDRSAHEIQSRRNSFSNTEGN